LIPVNVSTSSSVPLGGEKKAKCRKQFHFKNIGTFPRQGSDANPHSKPHSAFPLHCIRVRRTPYGDVEGVTETLHLDATKFLSYIEVLALGISDGFTFDTIID
jgi:hypothetical protein